MKLAKALWRRMMKDILIAIYEVIRGTLAFIGAIVVLFIIYALLKG